MRQYDRHPPSFGRHGFNHMLNPGKVAGFGRRQPGEVAPNEPVVESTEPSEPTPGEGEPAEKTEEVNLEPVVDEDTESKVKKLEKRVGYLQRRLERQAKRQGAPKLPDPIDDGTKPKADDYETIEDYQTAVQNWTIDKRVNEGVRKALATDPTEDVAADRDEALVRRLAREILVPARVQRLLRCVVFRSGMRIVDRTA